MDIRWFVALAGFVVGVVVGFLIRGRPGRGGFSNVRYNPSTKTICGEVTGVGFDEVIAVVSPALTELSHPPADAPRAAAPGSQFQIASELARICSI